LRFSIGDGTNTALVTFGSGTYSQTSILNTINAQLNSAGLSSSILAFYDSLSQLNLRVTKMDSQSVLQLLDQSTGSDSMLGSLGLASGVYLGPDPSIAGGSALRTREYLRNITSATGVVTDRIKTDGSFDRIISSYNDTISRMEQNVSDYEKSLRDKFARLETQLSELQSQSAAVTAAITQWEAQTSNSSSTSS
jgi:flagellar capping protein FliD